ncbi:MAG: hypothetical protein ACREJD_15105 [Phycisphaerales bacterium]
MKQATLLLMPTEPIVIREKTLKYWLVGGTVIAPGADRFWKLRGYTHRRRAFVYWALLLAVLAVGRATEAPANSGGILLYFFPLARDRMTAWQERPLTQGWIKSAMRVGAALSFIVVILLMFVMAMLARTLVAGSLVTFMIGMIVLGVAMIGAQMAIIRWSLRRAVRLARERVRDANGLICTDCGFALRGLDGAERCPECGVEFRAEEVRGFFRACGILDAAQGERGLQG